MVYSNQSGMNGWVKIHRKILDKPIWLNSTPEQKAILMTIILMANFEEKEWEWEGRKFKVLPGQFVSSLESIRQKSGKGISIRNVRSAITRFKKLDFMTEQVTRTGRIITVCKWEAYQDISINDRQSIRQRGDKEVTATKKGKKTKNNITDIFDDFRKEYPGTKRGLKTELDNFLKKNDAEIVYQLKPALIREMEWRKEAEKGGEFIAPWKHLSTWINQKCWEQEFPTISTSDNYKPPTGLKR